MAASRRRRSGSGSGSRGRSRTRKIEGPPAKPKAVPAQATPAKPAPAKAVTPKAVTPKAAPAKPATPAKPKAVPAKPAPAKAVAPVPPKAATPKAATPKAATAKAAKPAGTPKPAPAKDGKPAPASSDVKRVGDPLIGKVVARCKLLELVGTGKTAGVYRAHHEAFDMEVAVKVLTREASSMPKLVERFIDEARVIASLDNENVVKIYDVGSQDGYHFIVMEMLDGFSILDLIARDEVVDPMDALRILRQTATGLSAAHAKNIIHRDVKPQNLLLLEDGTVKVLDFGLAAQVDGSSERVGTPHYMAPETCKDGSADLGSDVYGMGIVLYHMLVGRPPYAGKNIQGILRGHIAGEPLRPERDRPGTPKEIAELVRSLTKLDPLTRPSASEVVSLADAIGGETLKEKAELQRRRRTARARKAAAKRSSGSPAMMIGIVVVLIGAIAAFVMSGGKDPKKTPKATTPTAGGGTQPGTTPDTTGGAGPTVPVDPEFVERVTKEAAARAKERAAEEKKAQSIRALADAESWARDNWSTQTDTPAVISRYQSLASRFKGTEVGKEVIARIRAIRKGELHPHPDKSWSDATSIAETRGAWTTAKVTMNEKILSFQYASALSAIPPTVHTKDGALTEELAFWRTVGGRLRAFASRLKRTKFEESGATVTVDGKEGEVVRLLDGDVHVSFGGRIQKFPWSEVGASEIAKIATMALPAEDAEAQLELACFCYAHGLGDAFWDVSLFLSSNPGAAKHKAFLGKLEQTVDERVTELAAKNG